MVWSILFYLIILLFVFLVGVITGVLRYKLRIRFAMRVMLPLAEWELKKLNESFKSGKLWAARKHLKMTDEISILMRPLYKKDIKKALHYRWQLKEAIKRVIGI